MKKYIAILLAGVIPVAVLFLFMKLVSLNLSYSVIVGVICLMMVSAWKNRSKVNATLYILLISLPLIITYLLLIVKELPAIWPVIILFMLSALVGYNMKKKGLAIAAGLSWLVLSGLFAIWFVPRAITADLSEYMNKAAPRFELENLLDEDTINASKLAGTVVILDFFGTWCAPCIAEMRELKSLATSLPGYGKDWSVILVCTDTGGDTPAKALAFQKNRELPFGLAYDHGAVAHKAFGFSGVPGLVILDKDGQVRFKHEGYNQAEHLVETLSSVITDLIAE